MSLGYEQESYDNVSIMCIKDLLPDVVSASKPVHKTT